MAADERENNTGEKAQAAEGQSNLGDERKSAQGGNADDAGALSPSAGEKRPKPKSEDGQTYGYEPVELGPKRFDTPERMYSYFSWLLNNLTLDQNINEYEHMVLEALLDKGHHDPGRKRGPGIRAFQVRAHPSHKSKSFFVIKRDGAMEDFSYRKCIENLMPTEGGQALLKANQERKSKKRSR